MSASLETLGDEECLRLLARHEVGRVGITVGALPEILPVKYAMLQGSIVFRTAPGTTLHAATGSAVIAFEVDECDVDMLTGWSVLVVGVTEEVNDPLEIAQSLAILPDGWVPGDREQIVRLQPRRISGRRLRHHTD